MKPYMLASVFLLFYTVFVHSASVVPKVFSDDEFISCNYVGGSDGASYECILSINNPNGIEFDQIEGTHLTGLSNADVELVNAYSGNSRIIPSVICRQFPNVYHLTIMSINVEELTPAAFAECRNLVDVFLVFNQITSVPANTFANSPRLEYIELSRNRISELNENSFTGTALSFVAIDYNELSSFDQNWFTSINGTLRHLEFMQNRIEELEPNAFGNLRELRELIFNYNTLTSGIADAAFDGLNNLESLSLSRTGITSISPAWFSTLSSLRAFYAVGNEITELVNGTFNSLTNFRELYLNGNRIRVITSGAFGPSARNLRTFYISDNRINNVDPYWLNDAENLEYLLLAGNLCTDQDFLNVPAMRWRIFEELRQCIDNYMLQPWAHCRYEMTGIYSCALMTHNPNGVNDFTEVYGEHVSGQNNSDVVQVTATFSNTRIIPTILCQQFSNLRTIALINSNVEDLSEESFTHCAHLEALSLHNNWIETIADFTFRNAPNLRNIDIGGNRIATLSPNSFTGTRLDFIDLDMNRFSSFDQRWLESVNSTLTGIDLFGNSLVMLEADGFSNLVNLQTLHLGSNPLWNIPATAFDSLVNLLLLNLSRCSLASLNPSWFRNLRNIMTLSIHHNNIDEFPDGVFDSLESLFSISFNDNNLRKVSADAFGSSLSSINSITADRNRIRAFDLRIVSEASNLNWLFLRDNICTQEDFMNIQVDRDFVINRLYTCASNFGPESIRCLFYQPGEQYTCSLRIFNPLGRNNFEDVEGDHMTGRTDEDVRIMYINEGKTLNIPSIICEKFPNLESMDFLHDEIEYLEESSFGNCRNLRRIYVYDNEIESIPQGLFRNNPLLEELSLGHNRLTARGIPSNIFAGTSLTFLDLSQNPIQDFNSAWIIPVASTLTTLEIYEIGATHLPILFFNNPSVLEVLDVSRNPIREIIPAVFDRLPTLKELDMAECLFRLIDPNWFQQLRALETLRLNGNSLLSIPEGTFASLTNLRTLYIYNNRLRELNVASFGASITSLQFLYASYNDIMGVDPTFLTSASSLSILYMAENVCAQGTFYNVSQDTSPVEEALSSCINNFSTENIRCNYVRASQNRYSCLMDTFNPLGRNNFQQVDGEHLAGSSDNDVEVIEIRNQNTRIIPSIICNQYRNLRVLTIFNSHLDLLSERNLNECRHLTSLMIYQNDLRELPNYALLNNDAIVHLELGFNRINRIGDFAFTGTAVESLDLAGNDLMMFNPFWFEPINSTLQHLDLLNANIRAIPANPFRNIRNLRSLVLSRNPLWSLPANIFEGLDNLEDLYLSNCELSFFDANWFRPLGSVRTLYLDNNWFSVTSPNMFNSFRSLSMINLSNNFFWNIGAVNFGNSLSSVQIINLSNNLINLIDESLIRQATNLQRLYLTDNSCSNQNLIEVNTNVNRTLNDIRSCVDNFVAVPSISCTYSQISSSQYMCALSVHDPWGTDNFQNIPGDHVGTRRNDDVTSIMAANQDSRTVPNIICRQFVNLTDISIYRSRIAAVNLSPFINCRNLRILMLEGGFITTLTPKMFPNNPNLEYVSLADNRIFNIMNGAFQGARIKTLDLAFNRLSTIIPEVMSPISDTLTVLNMVGNQIRGFPFGAFEELTSIEELYLDRNPLTELKDETFLTLSSLRVLSMAHCQLRRLNGVMFYDFVNMHTLKLNDNEIEMLPEGAFHNMTSLEVLYIGNNRINFLNATQFGGAMSSIRIINAPSNRINAIDRNLLQNSPNLNNLLLPGNICIDESFNYVQDELEAVLDALNICFDNFDVEPEIECTYDITVNDEYRCDARIHNPVDEDFQAIAGQHMSDRSDDDVQLVSVLQQNTKTFPAVICRQFRDIREIFVMESHLEILEAPAFENCRTLEQIYVNQNNIATIPARLFINSPNLFYVSLSTNRINQVHPDSFVGTVVESLDLGNNRLTNINPQWFAPISQTLDMVDFFGNLLTRVPDRTFTALSNLEFLMLGNNHVEFGDNPFDGLTNLKIIGLGRNGLRELNPLWFTPIPQLEELFLCGNGISELQDGIFSNFTNLLTLRLNNNFLSTVRAASIGSAVSTLRNLQFIGNYITSFDQEILNDGTNLQYLMLAGNVCINENFYDVPNERSRISELLQQC
ncbi:unnamed protein product [Chironomus riparius]|uniref:Uncharacterized protein n=1 Tax=Chironomus riparius TaxID=315576 RepID=A0A9N9X1B1_9DIPT|nr:unnamed protein product [Chironomus riparius]